VERATSRRLAEWAAPVTEDTRTVDEQIDLAVAFGATDARGQLMLTNTRAEKQLRKECKGKGQSKGQRMLSRADLLSADSRRNRVSALKASRMGLQVQIFRRCEAAYCIMILVTRHNAWGVHSMTYNMVDGFIPLRFLLKLSASRGIHPPLEAKDFWNAMEIDYHYLQPRLELRRGGMAGKRLSGRLADRLSRSQPVVAGRLQASASIPQVRSGTAAVRVRLQVQPPLGRPASLWLRTDPSGLRPTVMCQS
jgi:hypothetical protein